MGAQASKQAVRRFPKEARRDPGFQHEKPLESPSTIQQETADDILHETRDAQLHKNLASLGPVKIEQTMTRMRTSDPMLRIMKERQRIEADEEKRPGVTIDVIFSALERRKHLAPGALDIPETWAQLEREYKIDRAALKTLFNDYNTITVLPADPLDSKKRRPGVWVENKEDWKKAVEAANARIEAHAKQQAAAAAAAAAANQQPSSSSKGNTKSEKEKKLEDLFDD